MVAQGPAATLALVFNRCGVCDWMGRRSNLMPLFPEVMIQHSLRLAVLGPPVPILLFNIELREHGPLNLVPSSIFAYANRD